MNISLRTSIAFAAIALVCSFWMGLYSRLEPVALTTTGLFILLLWVLATKPISFKQAGVGGAAFSLLFALFMVLGYHIQITGNTYQGAAAENFISPYTFADGVAFVAISVPYGELGGCSRTIGAHLAFDAAGNLWFFELHSQF